MKKMGDSSIIAERAIYITIVNPRKTDESTECRVQSSDNIVNMLRNP